MRTKLEREPVLTWTPLPTQHAVLSSPARRRLFRGGNQAVGKTTTGVVDLIATATGVNPWCPEVVTPFAPECWVLCASWAQSIAVQQKINELLPRHLLHPSVQFDEANGFRGKNPTIRIKHAPSGDWSIVRIKTVNQGGLNLSSATIAYAWFDEPPESQRVFSEVTKRVMRAGRFGRILMTMTPVNARVDWIVEEVDRGAIADFHARLEPHELIPVGRTTPISIDDGTVCDQAWIDGVILDTLPHEVPVLCHGEWRMSADAPVFTVFRVDGPRSHVRDELPAGEVELLLGIDHGVRTHTQVAVLCAVLRDRDDPGMSKIWVLDEYVSDGETTEDDDADGILTMLERNGIRWDELDHVHGDRAHFGSQKRGSIAQKSNSGLTRALEKHPRRASHGIKRGQVHPPIHSAKKGVSNQAGSVEFGATFVHRAMVRDNFAIRRACVVGLKSIPGYDFTPNSDESHWVDALRYGLRPLIYARGGPRRRRPTVTI